jgi:hypothetical protein
MKQLTPDLWIADQPLSVLGLELGARMTVVRLGDGRLLLHSPIKPAPDVVDEVRALGDVAALVAPNRFHHLFAAAWFDYFPGAKLFVAPGLETKRKDLPIAGVLSDSPEPLWAGTMEQVVLRGIPLTNEVVFYHPSSRTLIATDLAFHIGQHSPGLTRLVFRISGAFGKLAPTYLERFLIRDKAAFRGSVQRILDWPFERVVVAHGTVVETGGRRELALGYSWILDSA